ANSAKPVNIEIIDVAWGAYVGPIPSKLRAIVKMSGPISARDPEPFKMLAASGATSTNITFDLGIAWDAATRVVRPRPGTADIGSIGSLAVRASLANVSREMFSIDPLMLMAATAQVEAGPVEIVVRDAGGLDLVIAQQARTQNISADE